MILRFLCPICAQPGRFDSFQSREWQCPRCDHLLNFPKPEINQAGNEWLTVCPICGNGELYKKKGFPQWLGLSILTTACLAFLMLHNWYLPYWAWAVLLGSAVFDGVLYTCVEDVIVCYCCGTHVSGVPASEAHKPYELAIAERYRQARLRKEQQRNVRPV